MIVSPHQLTARVTKLAAKPSVDFYDLAVLSVLIHIRAAGGVYLTKGQRQELDEALVDSVRRHRLRVVNKEQALIQMLRAAISTKRSLIAELPLVRSAA